MPGTLVAEHYAYTEWTTNSDRLLFDRKQDPEENQNVANDTEYQHVVDSLSNILHDEFENDF